MADKKSILDAIESRRTIYTISPDNAPASNSRVLEIVSHVLKHTPSSYNSQTARAVVVFDEDHRKYWDAVSAAVEKVVPAEVWSGMLAGAIQSFKNGGKATVMWFEDEVALKAFAEKHASAAPFASSWSDQSNGMHQINAWTALEAEGFGASLQHLHFAPDVVAYMQETLEVPKTWSPKAQLVIGTPTAPSGEKTFEPIEGQRLKATSSLQECKRHGDGVPEPRRINATSLLSSNGNLEPIVLSRVTQGEVSDITTDKIPLILAKDFMIVVGNLNILRANFKHEERTLFIMELLLTLKKRGAYKTFATEAKPEKQVGAIRDADLPMKVEDLKEETTGMQESVVVSSDASVVMTPEDSDSEDRPDKLAEVKKLLFAMGLAGFSAYVEGMMRPEEFGHDTIEGNARVAHRSANGIR